MSEEPYRVPAVVLVAEDEALIRMCTADSLSEAGYVVIEVSSAAEALTTLECTADVRVLLTDVEMPGEMDGLKLAMEVQRRWPWVVIIVTSGRICPRKEDLAFGAEFLSKPICEDALVAKIRQRLSD